MRRLIYTPAEGEKREFIFDLDKIDVEDAELIEDVGGSSWGNWDDFTAHYTGHKIRAMKAALWLCMRRDEPALAFTEMPTIKAVELAKSYDGDELLEMRRVFLANPNVERDLAARQIALIDNMLKDEFGIEPPVEDDETEILSPDPKGEGSPSPSARPTRTRRSSPSGPGTDGPSPQP